MSTLSGASTLLTNLQKPITVFLESAPVIGFMSLITIWALFSDSIRLSGTNQSADVGFDTFISIVFFVFTFEIILSIVAKPEYRAIPSFSRDANEPTAAYLWRIVQIGSFYMWLDFLATLSLMFEISWMLGQYGPATTKTTGASEGEASAAADLSKLVRVVRMVRLIRLVKLYKYMQLYFNPKVEIKEEKQSHIGAAMSDILSRRVIVLILALLIVIPLLLAEEDDLTLEDASKMLHQMNILYVYDPATYSNGLSFAVKKVTRELPVLYLQLNGQKHIYNENRLSELRLIETSMQYFNTSQAETQVIFDIKSASVEGALLAIYMTLFIIVLLLGGIQTFANDVQTLVISPIETMITLVTDISANPLGVTYEMLTAEEMAQGMETALLLQTINKIGSLMRIGFGEAGAKVIAKNLAGEGNSLNLLGGGEMIHSIFGFCDVRQFTDTTECLQEEVMLFVNRIAHILHGIVVQCSGAANKNIGDAFLLTWKLDSSLSPEEVSNIADQALLCFCKTMVELGRGQEFICNFSFAATARLYKRFPGYKVRIGSGLHVGWAIEGAIGSNTKIDASYLSPNVNRTEFLESSTKEYGVALLLSEPFVNLLSPAASKYVRQVDRVRLSEKEEPFGMFTYDMDLTLDFWDLPQMTKTVRSAVNIFKNKAAIRRASFQNDEVGLNSSASNEKIAVASVPDPELGRSITTTTKPKVDHTVVPVIKIQPYTQKVWEEDNEVVQLRNKINDSFRALWKEGIKNYIKGDWPKARDTFHETLKLSNGEDGPSKHLIAVIDEHNGTAPDGWEGYRWEGGGH